MQGIINEVIESGKPDFPFCLGWANHSWYAKNWNTKVTKGTNRLLIEQSFPGDKDIRMHYEYVLKAFKDPRYIKVGNKPFFMIYIADDIPDNFISLWNKWAIEDGFDGIYFVANIKIDASVKEYINKGFSSVIKARTSAIIDSQMKNPWTLFWKKVKSHFFNIPDRCALYKDALKYFVDDEDLNENLIPNIVPGFDHSPRSGKFGLIFHGSTPELFYKHCCRVLELVKKKENKIIMLRSWNEWGEGNYMEPDLKYGKGYINALNKALKLYS